MLRRYFFLKFEKKKKFDDILHFEELQQEARDLCEEEEEEGVEEYVRASASV